MTFYRSICDKRTSNCVYIERICHRSLLSYILRQMFKNFFWMFYVPITSVHSSYLHFSHFCLQHFLSQSFLLSLPFYHALLGSFLFFCLAVVSTFAEDFFGIATYKFLCQAYIWVGFESVTSLYHISFGFKQ